MVEGPSPLAEDRGCDGREMHGPTVDVVQNPSPIRFVSRSSAVGLLVSPVVTRKKVVLAAPVESESAYCVMPEVRGKKECCLFPLP